MKAHVDKDTCIGCGLCTSLCPEVFSMDEDDGKSVAIADDLEEDVVENADEACASCPVEAITLED